MALSKSSLAARFEKMQQGPRELEESMVQERMSRLSLHQMDHMTIRFGEAKWGQTFARVFQEDPGYCRWFLGRWEGSRKAAHMEFTFYLKLQIERMELERSTVGDSATHGHSGPVMEQTNKDPPAVEHTMDLRTTWEKTDGAPIEAQSEAAKHFGETPGPSQAPSVAWDLVDGVSHTGSDDHERMDKLERLLHGLTLQVTTLAAMVAEKKG